MDAGERLELGKQAARKGRYEEALQEYVWFHEHALEHEPSYYGVRLSFALSYWLELGQVFPEAISTLRNIRNQKTRTLLEGHGDRALFHDVVAINDHLNEDQVTHDLFLKLHNSFPDLAASCASLAMTALVKTHAYQFARSYIVDPEASVRGWSQSLNQDIADLASLPPNRAPIFDTYTRIYTEHVRELLEILIGVGQRNEAESLRSLAVESIESPSAREAVRRALPPVGKNEVRRGT